MKGMMLIFVLITGCSFGPFHAENKDGEIKARIDTPIKGCKLRVKTDEGSIKCKWEF